MTDRELSFAQMLRGTGRVYLQPIVLGRSLVRAAVVKVWPHATKLAVNALGLVLLLATLYGIGTVAQRMYVPEVYVTAPRQTRVLTLEDGSIVKLAPNTELTVHYTDGVRAAALSSGEAFFTIQHQMLRPFQVTVGNRVVRDLGTSFNVRLLAEASNEVSVASGRVVILTERDARARKLPAKALQLSEGQGALLPADSASPPRLLSEDETRRRLLWQSGLLRFRGERLSEFVAEINRFSVHPLVIDDPSIAERSMDGSFPTSDTETLIRTLDSLGLRHRIVTHDGVQEIHLYGGSAAEELRDDTSPP